MYNDYDDQDFRGGSSRGWYDDERPGRGRDFYPEHRRPYRVQDEYVHRNRNSQQMRYRERSRSPRNNQGRGYRDYPRNRYHEEDDYDYNYDYDDRQDSYDNYDARYDNKRSGDRSRDGQKGRYQDRDDNRNTRDRKYRDNSREKRREPDRNDSYQSRNRDRADSRDSYRRDQDTVDKSNEGINAPCSTVIVQGLTQIVNERMIEDVLKQDGVRAKNVSVIRDRAGESKGFAFVEFEDIFDAEAWLKISKKVIFVDGQRAYLNYSRSKKSEAASQVFADWYCSECKILNFGSRRKFDKPAACFQCGFLKKEADVPINEEKVPAASTTTADTKNDSSKLEPCNVLMVRGMDFATTEDTIRTRISSLTNYPVFDVRLIRDKVTDMSRGFAFVEFGATEHAAELLEKIDNSDPPIEIEGRKIAVGFARHGYHAPLNGKKTKGGILDKQAFADNAFAQAAAANAALPSKYAKSATSTTDTFKSSAGKTTQSAGDAKTTQAGQAYQQQQQQLQQAPQAQYTNAYLQPASQSTYTYDPTSGYYYDSSTGLYYDANSGYYYNGTTGQYLYWNGTQYQYINQDGTIADQNQQATSSTATVTTTATASAAPPPPPAASPPKPPEPEQQKEPPKAEDKDKVPVFPQNPKSARKIAKDMERWAKKMNTANEARQKAVKLAQEELKLLEQKEELLRKKIFQEKSVVNTLDIVAKNKDGIKSLFVPDNDEEGSVLKLESALLTATTTKPRGVSLVADVPEEEDDVAEEMKFVDTVKMACLLCKRQFPNSDVLTKHLQVSQLHKQNMEKYRKSKKI